MNYLFKHFRNGRQEGNRPSFLWTGMTLPSLSLLGKIPVLSDWFIIKVKGLVNTDSSLFNNFNEIPSYPELDFEFNP